jgi:hypothetical protein
MRQNLMLLHFATAATAALCSRVCCCWLTFGNPRVSPEMMIMMHLHVLLLLHSTASAASAAAAALCSRVCCC